MKNRIITAPLAFAISLFLAMPLGAGVKDDRVKVRGEATAPIPDPGQEPITGFKDPVERFIESNVLETLYHEMAHALIDTMNLPVFGPEEFAADFFAAILLDRVHDDDTTRQLVADVQASYRYDAAQGRGVAWDEHGSAMQRYYNLACLYYGADPDGRKSALQAFQLPDDRAVRCAEEYEQANFAWGGVLDELAEAAPGNSITLDWILDKNAHLTRYVTKEVAALNRMIVLPTPIVVSVIPCGEVNAYYDPEKLEIIICTELSEHLASIAP
ncbi:MAG TPA: hypothetical protein ENK41_06215 [Rhodobacteraceae bacterium]|nr:hypothetical protein [Paracoccaceae bacterium]